MPPAKILIVDDEPAVARSMQKTLLRAGFQVETAPNVQAGWQALQSGQFALVLLDLNMPGFDGVPAPDAGMQLLKRIQTEHPMPVIILSAYDDPNLASQAVAAGARGFTVKGREQTALELIQSILGGTVQ
ncbi:MAG: hypothetical protein CO094_07150 [Anaerolineae bacterium CG_4_9_14_3_um_filter_57_17]|nr:response regulator [bacterium]NCT21290.1 response regulator [bacterium]OIO84853.1 MAG: hypothetical protein AUK01_08555 [Anaerolineae bacterium CG2_30_57_67]PJB66425.1 MAG: hypothetical protein CO094_07150 [Anaerolineae bacterium CG_4_9_14_3_um_filter_57_17]